MTPSVDNLRFFAHTNVECLHGKAKCIVVEHMGLGSQWTSDPLSSRDLDFGEKGIAFLIPYNNPWCWMNDAAIVHTDLLVSLLKERLGIAAGIPICSTGGSMGGLSALVHARYTKHPLAAVVANCPVCDLPYHMTERPDLPRTIWSAFGDSQDFDAALRAHSPLHLASSMPRVPYSIFHGSADTAVSKEQHSDRLVAALRAAGHDVAYHVSEGAGHCDLRAEQRAAYDAAIFAAFD